MCGLHIADSVSKLEIPTEALNAVKELLVKLLAELLTGRLVE